MNIKKLITGVTTAEHLSNLNDNFDEINKNAVENTGSQKIKGDLIIEKTAESSGDLIVQGDLIVHGDTISEEHETLLVKENVIVANSTGESITDLSGLAIRKNESETYGIMYDPLDDTVKLGLGDLNLDNEFEYHEGQGLPLAVRDIPENADEHFIMWNEDKRALVDGQNKLQQLMQNNANAHFEVGDIDQTEPSDTLKDGGIFLQLMYEEE